MCRRVDIFLNKEYYLPFQGRFPLPNGAIFSMFVLVAGNREHKES